MKDLTLEDLEKMENMTIEEQLEYLDSVDPLTEEDEKKIIEYNSQFVDDDGNFDHEASWLDFLREREEIDKEFGDMEGWDKLIEGAKKLNKNLEEIEKQYPRREGQTSITGLMRQLRKERREEDEKMSKMTQEEQLEYMRKKHERVEKWIEEINAPSVTLKINEGEDKKD